MLAVMRRASPHRVDEVKSIRDKARQYPDLTSAFGGTADMTGPAASPGPVENDPGCVKTPCFV